jgi:polyisoprenoid-binding protein YceI
MARITGRWIVALSALLLGQASLAEGDCYESSAENGELRFSGIAEGSPFSGRFEEFNVSVCLNDDDLAGGEIRVEVATGSATIGNSMGDRALEDEELFHVERFPEAIWTSDRIVADEEGYRAEGELTLRGVTADQTVRLRLLRDEDPVRLTGGSDILRLDHNVGIGEFEDTDFIGNEVRVEFDLSLK